MTLFGGHSADIKLVTEYLSSKKFLLQVSHPNEFYSNVWLPAVNEKTPPRLLSQCPGSRSIIHRSSRICGQRKNISPLCFPGGLFMDKLFRIHLLNLSCTDDKHSARFTFQGGFSFLISAETISQLTENESTIWIIDEPLISVIYKTKMRKIEQFVSVLFFVLCLCGLTIFGVGPSVIQNKQPDDFYLSSETLFWEVFTISESYNG